MQAFENLPRGVGTIASVCDSESLVIVAPRRRWLLILRSHLEVHIRGAWTLREEHHPARAMIARMIERGTCGLTAAALGAVHMTQIPRAARELVRPVLERMARHTD